MGDSARLYLRSPERVEPGAFAEAARAALEGGQVACLRLSLGSDDEAVWRAAAGPLRQVCAARDVALVVDDHYRLVEPLGLDGVHLRDARVPLRKVRAALGAERIVGAYAGASRHQGLMLAEAGADYVSFGPIGDPGRLGGEDRAEDDLFAWWAEMIEVPVVAEGALGVADAARLSPFADFVVPDTAIWDAADVAGAVRAYAEVLQPLMAYG